MTPGRLGALLLVAALSGALPLASANGIYTWTDDQGVVHFSDQAPQRQGARQLDPGPPVLVPMGDNLEAARRIGETVSSGSSGQQRRKPGAREESRKQKQRCDRYREQLDHIQSRLRAGYSNTQGNRLRERRRTLNGRLSRECILG